jgi:hypothetical protein
VHVLLLLIENTILDNVRHTNKMSNQAMMESSAWPSILLAIRLEVYICLQVPPPDPLQIFQTTTTILDQQKFLLKSHSVENQSNEGINGDKN